MLAVYLHTARLGATMYYRALQALQVTAIQRRLRNAALVLCYHNVVAPRDGGTGDTSLHVTSDRFAHQMRWLAAHYEIVPLRDLLERIARGASLRSLAAITFDDGYAGVFEHAVPILYSMRIPATVFVVADAPAKREAFWWDHPEVAARATPTRRRHWLERLRGDSAAIRAEIGSARAMLLPPSHRAATWDAIRASLRSGIEIGVHSATHRSLPTLSDEELEREIVGSRADIHRATGTWPDTFSYPYGIASQRVRERVRAAGYRAAFGLERGLNGAGTDVWDLHRINIPASISDRAFEAWTAGLYGRA
jgi:peptidoglycan/xylan/chitin deacetylase (PgdA/CDA1 family)